jgi:hypothetical protein
MRPSDSNHDALGNPLYMSEAEIKSKIEQSIPTITSEIESVYSLIKARRSWLPSGSVTPEIREFYQQLQIPLFNRHPSLLLHGLDATPTHSDLSKRLFEDSQGSEFR